ncbi:MAG: hypothetical protein ACW96N_01820 [Candidatus Thorarchaeota archaeon]|jgi:hypothetical protein
MMLPNDWESSVRESIERFPQPHKDKILAAWYEWLQTNPESPYYESWSEYSTRFDDQDALYTETRVYLKRVTNELRDFEVPLTNWQKIAKALAAVASVFLVIFLALSRVMRGAE